MIRALILGVVLGLAACQETPAPTSSGLDSTMVPWERCHFWHKGPIEFACQWTVREG